MLAGSGMFSGPSIATPRRFHGVAPVPAPNAVEASTKVFSLTLLALRFASVSVSPMRKFAPVPVVVANMVTFPSVSTYPVKPLIPVDPPFAVMG